MTFLHKSVGSGQELFGADLRDLRELHEISFERACSETKIDPKFLSAFEEDRIMDLDDPIFAEHHFMAYVRYLGGHEPYFKAAYRKLIHELLAKRTSKDILPRMRSVRFADLFVAPQFLAFCGILLFALIIGGYVLWQTTVIQSAPPVQISSPQDGAVLDRSRVSVEGTTAPEASVTVNGRMAPVDQSGHFSLELDVKRGTTAIVITSKRRHGAQTVVTRSVMFGSGVIDTSNLNASSTQEAATSTR
ncbi:MAG: helix-turn-helix domain-containing protein [Patescibacteria group bacterium]